MRLHWRLLLALTALIATLAAAPASAGEPTDVVLDVPYRSQLDGSIYAPSNCGPTSIGMVLEAYGEVVPTRALRERSNRLLGVTDPSSGSRIQDLAQIVQEHGLSTWGLYAGGDFRRWTLNDVRREVRQGRPVIPQVYYPLLPNHREHPVDTDHYVVIVGVSGDDFIFNDPVDRYVPGYHVTITADELARAWRSSSAPLAAFSVGPGSKGRSLLPSPTPTPTPEQQAQQPTAEASPTPKPVVPDAPTPSPAEVAAEATPTTPAWASRLAAGAPSESALGATPSPEPPAVSSRGGADVGSAPTAAPAEPSAGRGSELGLPARLLAAIVRLLGGGR